MTWPLPESVRTYLTASTGDGGAERIAPCFTANATVHDESHTHVGAEAIGRWAKDAYERYRFALEIRDVENAGDAVAVTAQVSGTFPGSPILLRYAFQLKAGKIHRLDIAPPR